MFRFFYRRLRRPWKSVSQPKALLWSRFLPRVIRCDFSVFLVGLPPMIKWSNRKVGGIHLARLTWNLKMHPWKRRNIFQTIIFRFYVNLGGCMFFSVLTLDWAIGPWKIIRSMCLACDPGGSFWGSIVHVAAHSRGPICSPLYNEKKQITAVSYQRSKGPQNFSNNTNLTVRNHDTFDVLISSIVMQHAYVCIFHRCSCIEKIWNNRTQLNMVASKCSKNFLCCGRVKAFLKSRCTRSEITSLQQNLEHNHAWKKITTSPSPTHIWGCFLLYSYYSETGLTLTSKNTCQANTWEPPSMGVRL